MTLTDIAKATGVAAAVLVLTLAASFPMVAFYAYFIAPGHPQEFYTEAAQWIAPWSSHVLGPLLFCAFNFVLAKRKPERNATAFAASTILMYIVIEIVLVAAMAAPLAAVLTGTFALSLAAKAVGALLGAHLGAAARPAELAPRRPS